MRLLLDGISTPHSVLECARSIAKQANIDWIVIRDRDSDLYKVSSKDFDDEVLESNSLEALRTLLNSMRAGDILVTADDNLAELAVHLVTVVIHPDGKVYTPETMDMIKITKQLNRLRGLPHSAPIPITHRKTADDKAFRNLIIQYLDNVTT